MIRLEESQPKLVCWFARHLMGYVDCVVLLKKKLLYFFLHHFGPYIGFI